MSDMASMFEEVVDEGYAPPPPSVVDVAPPTIDEACPPDIESLPDWVGESTDMTKTIYITAVPEMLLGQDRYEYGVELLRSGTCTIKDFVGESIASKVIRGCFSVEEKNNHPHVHIFLHTSAKFRLSGYIHALKKNGLGINECRPTKYQKKCLLPIKYSNAKSVKFRKDVARIANYCSQPSSEEKGTIIQQYNIGDWFEYSDMHDFIQHTLAEEPKKKKQKTKQTPSCVSDFDVSKKSGCIALCRWWLDNNAKFYTTLQDLQNGLIEDDVNGEILEMIMERDEQMAGWHASYMNLKFKYPKVRCLGLLLYFGESDCGKTFNLDRHARQLAAAHLDERWDDDQIPITSLLYDFNLKDSSKTGHLNEPFLRANEMDGSLMCLSDFKQCMDTCPSDKRSYVLPVKYSKKQHLFNHLAMMATSNDWPTDFYYDQFGKKEENWNAFRRRIHTAMYFPPYRVVIGDDGIINPSNVERDENNEPVKNMVVLDDDDNVIRDSQSIDLSDQLRSMTWREALQLKVTWLDQLGNMSEHEKARITYSDTTNHDMEHDFSWDCGRPGGRNVWTRR